MATQRTAVAVAQHWLLLEPITDAPEVGTLAWVCEHLGLDPERIREGCERLLQSRGRRLPDALLIEELEKCHRSMERGHAPVAFLGRSAGAVVAKGTHVELSRQTPDLVGKLAQVEVDCLHQRPPIVLGHALAHHHGEVLPDRLDHFGQ